MTITLNHTLVWARDKEGAARFFAKIFGLHFEDSGGHFAPVRVNDTLTLDFADAKGTIAGQHYAFHVSDAEFDAILQRFERPLLRYATRIIGDQGRARDVVQETFVQLQRSQPGQRHNDRHHHHWTVQPDVFNS